MHFRVMSVPELVEISCTGVDYTLFQASWVPSSPRLVVCGSTLTGEGVIRLYSLSAKVMLEERGEVRERFM